MPRELIDTGTDKRYVRRDEQGQFKESDDVGRASATDQKRDAKNKATKATGRGHAYARRLRQAPRTNHARLNPRCAPGRCCRA